MTLIGFDTSLQVYVAVHVWFLNLSNIYRIFTEISVSTRIASIMFQKATGNDTSENAAGFVNLLLLALATFSTAYNIVLYVLFNPSFKQAIIGVLKCAKTSEMNDRVSVEQSHVTSVSPLDSGGVVAVVADNSRKTAGTGRFSSFSSLEGIHWTMSCGSADKYLTECEEHKLLYFCVFNCCHEIVTAWCKNITDNQESAYRKMI